MQVVDFSHATHYLWKAAEVLFAEAAAELRPWIDDWCHRLKHESGAAGALIAELETRARALGHKRLPVEVGSALTYFRNQDQGGQMNYAELVAKHLPIGSGVTEAACKVLVKQRLCGSGMNAMEGTRHGGSVKRAVPDVHAGAVEPVLEPDRVDRTECNMIPRSHPRLTPGGVISELMRTLPALRPLSRPFLHPILATSERVR